MQTKLQRVREALLKRWDDAKDVAHDHTFFGQFMRCRSSADCDGSLCVAGECVPDALGERSRTSHDNCMNTAETREEKARCKRDRKNEQEFTCTSDLAFRKEKGSKAYYGDKEYLELDGNCHKKYEYCKKHRQWGLEEARNSQGFAQGAKISSEARCRRKMEECVKSQGSNAHKGVLTKGQLCGDFQNRNTNREASRRNFIKSLKFDVGPRDGVDYQVCSDKSLGHKYDISCPLCLESRDCEPSELCVRGECRPSSVSCSAPDPREVSMKSVYCTEMDRPTFVQTMQTNRDYRNNCSEDQLGTKYDRLCQDYAKCSEKETVGGDSALFPTVEQKYDACNLGKAGDQFGHFKKVVKDQPQFRGCTDNTALRNKYDASCTPLTVAEIGRLAVASPGKASRAGAVRARQLASLVA